MTNHESSEEDVCLYQRQLVDLETTAIAHRWSQAPALKQMVRLEQVFEMENPCCGRSSDRVKTFEENEWIGKVWEIGGILSPDNSMCVHCSNCHEHYHIQEEVFVYMLKKPGVDPSGNELLPIACQYELSPLEDAWNMGNLNLDPDKRS